VRLKREAVKTSRAPAAIGPLLPGGAGRAGSFFCSGQIPARPVDGEDRGRGDRGRRRSAFLFEPRGGADRGGGGRSGPVVKTTVYLVESGGFSGDERGSTGSSSRRIHRRARRRWQVVKTGPAGRVWEIDAVAAIG